MHQNWFDQTSMKSKSTSIQSVSDRYWSNIKIASAAQSNHAPMFLNRMMNELFCFGLHFCLLRGIYGWSRHWWDYGFMCNSRCLAEQKYWLFSLIFILLYYFTFTSFHCFTSDRHSGSFLNQNLLRYSFCLFFALRFNNYTLKMAVK
mgnify:CR=1 FL=1